LDVEPDAPLGIIDQAGLLQWPIRLEHAAAVRNLPPVHSDPFDRMLIARATVEPLHLVTVDRHFTEYSPPAVLV